MKTSNTAFKAFSVRRRPIPGHKNSVSYSMFVMAEDLPDEFPDENVRSTTDVENKQVYKEIRQTLLNEDGQPNSFVFKNLGVRVIADALTHDEKTGLVTLKNARTPNGAHTLKVVKNAKDDISVKNSALEEGDEQNRIIQCIDLRVDVGIPAEWETEIVQANNNTVGVKKLAFANHKDYFAWVEKCVPDARTMIDFRDEGSAKINATDLLCILSLFNIRHWPNFSKDHPISGYASANQIVSRYLEECRKAEGDAPNSGARAGASTSWAKLSPIVHDILILRDLIGFEARDLYQENDSNRKFGKLSFSIYTDAERRTPTGRPAKKQPPLEYHFINEKSQYGLMRGALYPIHAAFRALVEEGPDGKFYWVKDFEYVKSIWRELGQGMIESIKAATNNGQTSSDSVAKSPNTWKVLHQAVMIEHMRRNAS